MSTRNPDGQFCHFPRRFSSSNASKALVKTTMEDTAKQFKCFPMSPNQTNKRARNSSPCWLFSLINPSNRKINVISPREDQVSKELQSGETVSKEEHDRVLQERNSLKDQILRKNEEINKLMGQVCRLRSELHSLILDSNHSINLKHAQDEAGSSSNNEDQFAVTTAESNEVTRDQNKEAIQEAKTQPVVRLRPERDIIGARASPLPPLPPPVQRGGTPPISTWSSKESPDSYTHIFDKLREEKQVVKPKEVPTWSTKESPDSYAQIFDKVRKENQIIKAKEAGTKAARAEPIAPARPPSGLCYTDIFHTLVAGGLITPQSPETDESGLYSHTSYLQICEYHKGGRGHSTENCRLLRVKIRKLIGDGVIKVEPPNLVVFQNKSSVPTLATRVES